MTKIYIITTTFILCILSSTAFGRQNITAEFQKVFSKGDSLFTSIIMKDRDKSLTIAQSMVKLADEMHDKGQPEEELAARSYIAEYYVSSDRYPDAFPQLERCLAIWEDIKNDEKKMELFGKGNVINKMFNSLALYYINHEANYEKAVKYLIEGLNTAKEFGNHSDYIVMGSNLVMVDFIRENPEGITYALEIYEYSKDQEDLFAKYSSAYGVALMYYIGNDFDNAEKYIKEALSYINIESDRLGAYNTYANILHAKGLDKEAEENYARAYTNIGNKSGTAAIYTCLSYGNFLLDIGQYNKAIDILHQGIDIVGDKENYGFTYKLYESVSKAYAAIYKWENAYEYFRKYHDLSTKIFNTRREWAINELTVKYETARKEQMLQEKEISLAKRERALIVSLLTIIIVIGIAGIIYWQYINKNRTYKKIVRQYTEAIQKENKLQDRIRELEKGTASEKYAISSLTNDKNIELYTSLENLMQHDKIYHDPEISRDKVAEMIGTNRTYLSKAINDNTGKSFNQYIASYRIEEVLQILSDPNSNMPLKAIYEKVGFNSINTFYKTFKEEVGMTPTKYHEKILEIQKEHNH